MALQRSLFLACSLFCLPSFCQIKVEGEEAFLHIIDRQ